MVLISLDPFACRKLLFVLLALLGFSAICFADPVLVARRYSHAENELIPAFGVSPRAIGITAPDGPLKCEPFGGCGHLGGFGPRCPNLHGNVGREPGLGGLAAIDV
jgi:hypothetical protein